MCLDEDNTDTSVGLTNEELEPITKRQRQTGPLVSSTSEEETDIATLPEGIEEQYGFKINPVSSCHLIQLPLLILSKKASNWKTCSYLL